MKCLLTTLTAFLCLMGLLAASAAEPARTTACRRFMQGNSFTSPLADLSRDLARDAGFKDDFVFHRDKAGLRIWHFWNVHRNETKQDMANNGPFDYLTLQPHGHGTGEGELISEAAAAANLYREALKTSPDCALMVYANWAGWNDGNIRFLGDKDLVAQWEKASGEERYRLHLELWEGVMRRNIRYFNLLVDILQKEFPDKPVYIIPVGPALYKLNEEIKAGRGAGLKSISQLFNYGIPLDPKDKATFDAIKYSTVEMVGELSKGEKRKLVVLQTLKSLHGSETTRQIVVDGKNAYGDGGHLECSGYYLGALTHFASYYRKSPVGLPHEYKVRIPWATEAQRNYWAPLKSNVFLTKEQADLVQRIAWETMQDYPRTTVSNKQRPPKPDEQPPSPPANLRVTQVDERSVKLAWDPSADNVGVTSYAVYVDRVLWEQTGGAKAKPGQTDTEVLVEGLSPGRPYKLAVRAWDAEFNYAESTVDVCTRTADGGTTLLGFVTREYLHPFSMKPEDSALKAEQTAAGIRPHAAIGHGPGAKATGSSGFGSMDYPSIETGAATLAEAVEKGQYLTLTIAPEPGKTLALRRLVLARVQVKEPMSVAVMSSPGGFAAGKDLATLDLKPKQYEYVVDLSNASSLQKAAGPIELRLYFWGPKEGELTLGGNPPWPVRRLKDDEASLLVIGKVE